MNGLRVTKIIKRNKFGRVLGEPEVKKVFERQPFTRYLRPALGFMKIVHYRKSLISAFEEFFSSFNKIFTLAGGLSTRLSFFKVFRLF